MDIDVLALLCHLVDATFNDSDVHKIHKQVSEQCCSLSCCLCTHMPDESEVFLHSNTTYQSLYETILMETEPNNV